MHEETSAPRPEGWLARVRRHRGWISAAVAVACLTLAVNTLARQDWPAILAAVRDFESGRLLGAAGLVVVSFLALTAYDFLGLRLAGFGNPGTGLVVRASFVGFVMSMNFGFTVLSGGAVRAWYYGRAGIPAVGIAKILAHMAVTFFIGWLGLFGLTLIVWPMPQFTETFGWAEGVQRLFGAALLLALACYFAGCLLRWRPGFGRFRWQLPTPGLAFAQAAVSVIDAAIAGLVLYHLLSPDELPFLLFMRSFLTAVFVGMISQVPGGLGVIEATLTQLLGHGLTGEHVLATMIVYRALNFVAPLGLACVVVLRDYFALERRRT
ncbi:UPF0104 family protein [Opitutales bacterium ASA1]|uniref:lysylphosphatidylglycerol synthase domain-containing protein n=1 Tax=Congregicoccus parvus TaxID=3081749 RepID=UPI002B2AEEED|nr:UPF0104 family protein [Opitutales bacterium ASA1]